MAPETKARKRLEEWIAQDPDTRTRSAIGKRIGVSQPSVSGWLSRDSRPESPIREALEQLTDGYVVARDWMTEGEKRGIRDIKPMEPTGTGD